MVKTFNLFPLTFDLASREATKRQKGKQKMTEPDNRCGHVPFQFSYNIFQLAVITMTFVMMPKRAIW